MNKYKLISLLSLLFFSILCSGQTSQEESEHRVVVLIDDQAIVAILDSTGAVAHNLMNIPSYFDDNHEDAYYVALSYKSDISKKEEESITKEIITSIDTSEIKSTRPDL